MRQKSRIHYLLAALFLAGSAMLSLIGSSSGSAFARSLQQLRSPSADTTINTAEGANFFTPAVVTIQAGDTITFTNAGSTQTSPGFHNVDFDDSVPNGSVPSGFVASSATTQPWTVTVKFDEPGTYFFFCEPHKAVGMVGRITVEAPTEEIYLPLIAR